MATATTLRRDVDVVSGSASDLSFYQQVKLVNFIRRQIHQNQCYGCRGSFGSRGAVLAHIQAQGHVMTLPDVSTWDQPQ